MQLSLKRDYGVRDFCSSEATPERFPAAAWRESDKKSAKSETPTPITMARIGTLRSQAAMPISRIASKPARKSAREEEKGT